MKDYYEVTLIDGAPFHWLSSCGVMSVGFRAGDVIRYEGIVFGGDENAAMLARDEAGAARHGSAADCAGRFDRYRFRDFDAGICRWTLGDEKPRKPSVKPAISGLTTVHDGKHRGIGFVEP